MPLMPSQDPQHDTEKLLTAHEVARRLAVSRSTIARLRRKGRLPSVQIGRARRWKLTTIRNFIDDATR